MKGKWVQRGMVWRFVREEVDTTHRCSVCGDPISKYATRCRPCAGAARRDGSPRCVDCDAKVSHVGERCHGCNREWPVTELIERLEANLGRRTRPAIGVICDACGCLCAVDEDCPGCRVWAREREAEANQRHKHNDLWMEAA